MKWLKKWESWEHSNSDSKREELKEKFILIFNDLFDIFIEEIDKISDNYHNGDIKIFSTFLSNDEPFYHLESSYYVTKSDIVIVNDEIYLSDDLSIEIALSYDDLFLTTDYKNVINKMSNLYPDIKFDTMDPYSF